MGTWGYGPFDCDEAADVVITLAKKIARVVRAKTDASAMPHYAEARAVAQVVRLAHGTDILGGPSLPMALKALARMRSDVSWLAGAREPSKLAEKLNSEIVAIIVEMRTCKVCRRAYSAAELNELGALAQTAINVPVPPARRRPKKKRKSSPRKKRKRKQ